MVMGTWKLIEGTSTAAFLAVFLAAPTGRLVTTPEPDLALAITAREG